MKSAILTGKHCRSNLRPEFEGLFSGDTLRIVLSTASATPTRATTQYYQGSFPINPYPHRQYLAITNHLTTTLITAINSNDALSHSFVTCTPICSIFNALHHFLDCLLIGIGYPLLKRVMLARFMCQMSGYDGLSVASGIHRLISDEEEVVDGLGP